MIAAVLALPSIAAVIVGATRGGTRLRLIAMAAVFTSAVASVALVIADRDPIANTISTQGLFLAVPCLMPFVIRWREIVARGGAAGVVAAVACAYIVLMPLFLRVNWTGVIWGPRYFLPIVPAAVVLAFTGKDGAWLARARTGLAAVSIVLQIFGLVLLERKLDAGLRMREALREAPQVIVTDVFWLPEEMSALFFEKKIVMPNSGAELAAALRTFRAKGVDRVAFVSAPAFHWYSPRTHDALRRLAVRHRRVETPGVPFLTIDIAEIPLRPPP